MPLLTTDHLFLLAECVPNLAEFHSPYLTMGQFIFHRQLYLFVMCVGIGSVRMVKPSICKIVNMACGLPWPQQLNKPPPPKLPAVPLDGRRRRNGR